MSQMRNLLAQVPAPTFALLQRWGKIRQEQLNEAILVTKDTVTGFIKRQAESGNWATIEQVLKGKPMTVAGKFMLEELRGKVVGSLILRLGLRRIIAVGIAGVLLPFILAKVAQEVMSRIKKPQPVQQETDEL